MNDLISQTITPASINEVCDAVRAHNHSAIYPVGAGSWMDLGYSRTKPGVEISTLQLNRVVDYPHEELTITVEAGTLISELSKILAEKGQMLPFDCPYPEKATLGGLLATNTSGPRRLAYGTARDSVIGLDVVNAQGERIHGGGRVVKNVAGYDMPKMHIGALGTLGIIVEATIKVRPMAEASSSIEFGVDRDRLSEILTAIRSSKLRPIAVEVETSNYDSESYGIGMLFEECQDAVDHQLEVARSIAEAYCPSAAINLIRSATPWSQGNDPSLNVMAMINIKPSSVAGVLNNLWKRMEEWNVPLPCLIAQPMNGIVGVEWEWTSRKLTEDMASLTRQLAIQHDGRFSIPRCPDEWKRSLPIWGDLGPEIEWMRRLRDSLDPNHVLNPGRFVVD
jgi:glycolate oxidase FAD binding subunit